jgi:hypothetical protein
MRMRITGFIVQSALLTVLLSMAMRAQVAAPPSKGVSKVAALVGFRVQHAAGPDTDTNVAAFTYETWLIVRDETGVHAVAKMQDIIVPRKTGFWRVGVQPTCQFAPPDKNNPDDHGNIHTEAIEYAVPIDQAPQVGLTDPACDAKTAARMLDAARDSNADQDRKDTDPTECGFTTEWLEGVLPDLLSIAWHEGQSESCEPRGFHWEDIRWVRHTSQPAAPHSTDGKVVLGTIFGTPGERAWKRVVRASIKENTGEGCFGNETVDDASDITDWYFEHSGGSWNAVAFLQIGNGGCQLSGDPRLKMPRSLTGEPPLPAWLISNLKKQSAKNALLDAWISPEGSLLIQKRSEASPGTTAYQTKEVGVFDSSGEKIGTKMLDLPAHAIVMVQWATGRFVDQWLSALRAAANGLPASVMDAPSQ